jgi:hypothetical protein
LPDNNEYQDIQHPSIEVDFAMPKSEIDMRVEAHLFSGLGGWLRFLSRGTRILEKMVDALPYEADTR